MYFNECRRLSFGFCFLWFRARRWKGAAWGFSQTSIGFFVSSASVVRESVSFVMAVRSDWRVLLFSLLSVFCLIASLVAYIAGRVW